MKNKALASAVFAVLYAAFLGLGLACFLETEVYVAVAPLLGMATHMGPVILYMIIGFLSLIAVIVVLTLNIIIGKELSFSKKVWVLEFVCAFVLIIPMLISWLILFGLLF